MIRNEPQYGITRAPPSFASRLRILNRILRKANTFTLCCVTRSATHYGPQLVTLDGELAEYEDLLTNSELLLLMP
jgi:hypothetical protein